MKFRFLLKNLNDENEKQYKTLKDIADFLKIPYHQARSLLLADEKQFIHTNIKELTKQYKITQLT